MGLSFWHLLVLLVIVLVVFGTKRLRTIGSDLGGAVKGFKQAMNDNDDEDKDKSVSQLTSSDTKDADFKSTPANEHSSDKSSKR